MGHGGKSCYPSRVTTRVLIVGAGGIGGVAAARLIQAGHTVCVSTTNADIERTLSERGLRVIGDRPMHVPTVRTHATPDERFDWIVLCTQPPSVEAAARAALPHLATDGHFLVLQNGLCETRVGQLVGDDRVLGVIVTWGASMHGPGVVEQTAKGAMTIGRPNGLIDAPVFEAANLLAAIAPTHTTSNLLGARMSKLALNCAVSSIGTIAGETLGPLLLVPRYRRLGLEVISEVVAVARARAIKLERVAGTMDLGWLALTDAERAGTSRLSLAAKHAVIGAVGLRYRGLRSSMLAAIERGRPPAVDFLNGEVVELGRRAGVPTPNNQAIVRTIWAIARGEMTSSRKTLDGLCGHVS